MEEKVDILLTTYNSEIKYLKQQIETILNQTYSNFQLLVSDDASTKKEVKQVLESYQKQDDRITLYEQEKNLGYNKNFEFLLKKSTAPYLMFADHDDVWYPQKIEKSVEKIKKEGVDLVYCNAHQIDEEGKIIQKSYFHYKNVPLIKGTNKLAISRCIGIGCSQIITKDIKEKMLPFTKEVIAHDWLASFLANEGKGMAYLEEPLFGYRLHQTNVFGGRNLSQNLYRWKKEHGDSYQSYLNYRNEKVIDKAYLDGAIMCRKYSQKAENKDWLEKMIKYYENVKKSKFFNIHIINYFRFLSGKNLLKKMAKEICIFHFPLIGYYFFKK